MGTLVNEIKNGEGTRVVHLLAMTTSALAVIAVALFFHILTDIRAAQRETNQLVIGHISNLAAHQVQDSK